MKLFKTSITIPKNSKELEKLCKEYKCIPSEIKREMFQRKCVDGIKESTSFNYDVESDVLYIRFADFLPYETVECKSGVDLHYGNNGKLRGFTIIDFLRRVVEK